MGVGRWGAVYKCARPVSGKLEFIFSQKTELYFFRDWLRPFAEATLQTCFACCVQRLLCQRPRNKMLCVPWVPGDWAARANEQDHYWQLEKLSFSGFNVGELYKSSYSEEGGFF